MDILETIVAKKREELAQFARQTKADDYERFAYTHNAPALSMREALRSSDTGIIAEFKRRSPSKGWIHADARPQDVVPAYAAAGASALSILTERNFFAGEADFLKAARQLAPATPLLRKDFIVEAPQVFYAKWLGADAVLLIAACLSRSECTRLANLAHEVGLEVLLEVHEEHELEYVDDAHPDMVGVNNRHLGTFHTDVATSFRMAELLPKDYVLVSESGISRPDTLAQLRRAGFRGFLIGETFMRESDPGQALARFVAEVRSQAEGGDTAEAGKRGEP